MIWLILGVALWAAVHLWKRVAPDHRAGFGDRGKLVVTVGTLVAIGLMIFGYGQAADSAFFWGPNAALTGINNILMVLAFYLYAASGAKSAITQRIRHPQLTAVKIWAVAHLLVNGDMRSYVLFGGLLAWAVASVILINRAQPDWERPEPRGTRAEVVAIVATVVVVLVAMLIHNWIGVQPWG